MGSGFYIQQHEKGRGIERFRLAKPSQEIHRFFPALWSMELQRDTITERKRDPNQKISVIMQQENSGTREQLLIE